MMQLSRHEMLSVFILAVSVTALVVAVVAFTKALHEDSLDSEHYKDGSIEPVHLNLADDFTFTGDLKHRGAASTVSATADGTLASPSVKLTAADSGSTYFVDVSTYTYIAQLPSPAAGLQYEFVMDQDSDAATKDFAVYTGSASIYLRGVAIEAGVIHAMGTTDTLLQFDGSAGAQKAGDRVRVISDGTHWYADAVSTNTDNLVSGTSLAV